MVFAGTRRFSHRLHALYEKRPLLMNSIVGGLVYVVGEMIVHLRNANNRIPVASNYPSNVTQINVAVTNKSEPSKPTMPTISYLNCVLERNQSFLDMPSLDMIDWHRVAHIGALGVVENGVLMLLWYRLLATMVGTNVRTLTVIVKCILDQIFFASQQDAIFLGYCGYLHSNTWQAAYEEVKKQFITTWLNDCSLWPLVNFIGFAYVPTSLQPTYMSCVQLFWQIYISSVAAPSKV
ncbi:Mpv17/PMP22 family protein, partial [archaeon]